MVKNKTITISYDKSCEMAKIRNGNRVEMEGNYWDFHPGCHGITKYGNFNTPKELSSRMREFYINKGFNVIIKEREYRWKN